MTKKHFIELANVIKGYNRDDNPIAVGSFNDTQIDVLATFCRQVNPRFNRERWINYIKGECGPNGGRVK